MPSLSRIREIIPFLASILLQVCQIRAENDFDYSLESPSLLTTSEIAEAIMNQNLNLNCAGLRAFFNSETFKDVEKILNMTSNSTEMNENREEYHSRIKRCTEIERQNRILHEFEKRNRKNQFIGIHKLDRGRFKQKHAKDNIHEMTTEEFTTKDDSAQDVTCDDAPRGDLADILDHSESTEAYSRTYRTIPGDPLQFTMNSASFSTVTNSDQNAAEKEWKIPKGNRHNIKDFSNILYPTLQMEPVQQKNTLEIKSTNVSENKETKKGLLKNLLHNIRNVMEGGTLKNSEDLSNSKFEEKSSITEEDPNEESLLEYETVIPHKFSNFYSFDRTLNDQKITRNPHPSSTENFQMYDEAKKQLQAKMEELVRIRKKFLEVVRLANLSKIQTQIIPSVAFNKTSIKNKKKVEVAIGKEIFTKEKNNQTELKYKFDKAIDRNSIIDARNDFIEQQTTYEPSSSSIQTSYLAPNLGHFTMKEQTTKNLPHETRRLSFLKTNDPSLNLPIEQSNQINLTSEIPSSDIHFTKHHFSKHEDNSIQRTSPPNLAKNELEDIFFSVRSQDDEAIKSVEDNNSQKPSRIREHITITTPSRFDSTTEMIHTLTNQIYNEDPLILRSLTRSPMTEHKVLTEEDKKNIKSKISGLTISEEKKSEILLQEQIKYENELASHSTHKNKKSKDVTKDLKNSNQHFSTPHFHDIAASNSPLNKEKYLELASVTSMWPELEKSTTLALEEKSFKEDATSSYLFSTKLPTTLQFSELETTSKDHIPTQFHISSRNLISESFNKSEVPSDVVGRSHQSIIELYSKPYSHMMTRNHNTSSVLGKLSNSQLTNRIEKLKETIKLHKQNLAKITHPVETSKKITLPQKHYVDDIDPFSPHRHTHQPHLELEKFFTPQPHPGNQHSLSSSHLDKISTIQPSGLFEEFPNHVTLPIPSVFEIHKFRTPAYLKELLPSEKTSTQQPAHSTITHFEDTTFPQPFPEDGITTLHMEHSHPHLIRSKISNERTLSQKFHVENDLIPGLLHSHSTLHPLKPAETSKKIKVSQKSHLENHSTHSHSIETHLKEATTPQKSHSDSHSIPQVLHHHSTLLPLKPTTTSKDVVPKNPLMENHPTHSHSIEISLKDVTSPHKSHPESHSISQLVHQLHQHSELPNFEKIPIFQPTHPTQIFTRETSPVSHEKSGIHSKVISFPVSSHLLEVSTKRSMELMPLYHQIGHQHTHTNQQEGISTPSSDSTEASSRAIKSSQSFHTDDKTISHQTRNNAYQNSLPATKSTHLPIEIGETHSQHIPQHHQHSKSTTKLQELHSTETILHSTPLPLHPSTSQVETTHHSHSANDNTIFATLEKIKQLEREKIEEIKKLKKEQLEYLHKTQINDHSQTISTNFDEFNKHSTNKIHATDGASSHAPKTPKHEAEGRSDNEHEIKLPKTHDITKPYPTSPTTFAILQTDFDILEKSPMPKPPLNPNDNWKYTEKLDAYYKKVQQNRQSTTSKPPTIHPPVVSTPKPKAGIVSTTSAPRVRPSMPSRNATRGQTPQRTSTATPPTQKPSSTVNYNINSTRNFNITINLVTPDSEPRENNEGDEEPENDTTGEDESGPFTASALPTNVPQKTNETPVRDFDNLPHTSIPRQSSPEVLNSSNLPSLNNTMQLPESSTRSHHVENNEHIPILQIKNTTPSDDSAEISYTLENKDSILQSPTPLVTKSSASSTTATTPYKEVIKIVKSLTSKIQSQPYFETDDYSTTQPPNTLSGRANCPPQIQTVPTDGNQTQKGCSNIIIIPNKTEEMIEILRLLNLINANNETPSTDPSPVLQAHRSAQVDHPKPYSNPLLEIKSLLRTIQRSKITLEETIELRKSISELLKVLKQRRMEEYQRLYLSKVSPMVGDGRDSIQTITQINEYVELLELMMVYLARDPNKLLDEIKDARFDNFESPYPHDDPQRRLIEDQFYFVHPKILNEFIDVYKRYSKDEPYFGKPTWQFSEENGPRRVARQRSLGNSLDNLFHLKELIPALTYNRAQMYKPKIEYVPY